MSKVRPSDAASLLVYRRRGRDIEVLMGRRRRQARFSPGMYVFPGGVLEPADRRACPATELAAPSAVAFRSPAHARALAMAAVRETAEETGLYLGLPGDVGIAEGGWRAFLERGLAPALDALIYVGRAITPTISPHRYHARFFMAESSHLQGELAGDGELVDLHWLAASAAGRAGLMDVTEAMLVEAAACLAEPRRERLFLCYRGEHSHFRRESPGPRQ